LTDSASRRSRRRSPRSSRASTAGRAALRSRSLSRWCVQDEGVLCEKHVCASEQLRAAGVAEADAASIRVQLRELVTHAVVARDERGCPAYLVRFAATVGVQLPPDGPPPVVSPCAPYPTMSTGSPFVNVPTSPTGGSTA